MEAATWFWSVSVTIVGMLVWYFLMRPKPRLPPGPRGWPVVGYTEILGPDMWINLQKMSDKYGDIFSFYLGNRLTVVLNSQSVIREAFVKSGTLFAGRPHPWVMKLVEVQEMINNGTYSEQWKAERKFVLHAMKQFGYGSATLDDKLQSEVNTLMRHYESYAGKSFNPRDLLPRALANLIFSILINESYDYDSPELLSKVGLIHKWQHSVGRANLLDLFPILRFFPWQPMKRLRKVRDEITAVFRKHVIDHKEAFDGNTCRDVIDVYLKERGPDFDTEKLVGLFFSFSGDAVDSLPESMVWVLLFISAYPEVQEKMYREIISITGDTQQVSLADRQALPYVEAVIMESLRISSFVPISEPHTPLEDGTLLGFDLPKSCVILGNFYAAHMDSGAWGDPKNFRPERFLDDKGNVIHHEAYMPFGIGRRICLGEQLAKKVLFLYTATLVSQFQMTFDPDSPAPSLEAPTGYVRKTEHFKLCARQRDT